MVCNRCIMAVKNELEKFGHQPLNITLGEVLLSNEMTDSEKEIFGQHLKTLGFEMIDDKKSRIIGQIKSSIIEIVNHQNGDLKSNLSDSLVNERESFP